MRARYLLFLALATVIGSAARAQLVPTGPDGAGGGGTTQLAQFQPGLSPLGSNLDLMPGQRVKLALYCIDLFADTPTDQVAFTAPGDDATVTLASGRELNLGEALQTGLVLARGRGPGDPVRPAGQWFDAYLTNLTDEPLHVAMPAGTLLVPRGQTVPEVRPSVRRLFAAARERGLLGSDALARAVWATRGFTREDVEQTTMTPLTDTAARQVQELLAAADLGYNFDPKSGDYSRLYAERRGAMSSTEETGSALLPDGHAAHTAVTADATGKAVIAVTPDKGGHALYYAGQIVSRRPDRMIVELRHLKTGRPLEARGPIMVKLAS